MCWKKNCMSPNQCQDTYSVFMRVCVCAHTCNYTHVKTINGFTYTQSCTFTCRCFQSLTAQKTGLSCSNEKHMCSSRLNLLQAHLLLAKHFHLHLNQSVSFLSVSSVSMCVGWINVLAKCCVWEWWCIRMTYTVYGMFARVICPFRSPCLTPYSSLSSLCPSYPSISLPFFTFPVVKPISTLCASSNNDHPDMNQGVSAGEITERHTLYSKQSKVCSLKWKGAITIFLVTTHEQYF